jgi:plasmid maintenance system antidote protein VapI
MTASTAVRLATFFGTTPEFWMNAQLACDLYDALRAEQRVLERIEPVGAT